MNRLLTATTAALLTLAAAARAQTFNWGNALFDTVVTSDGTAVDSASFTFQLGAFVDGFDPSTASYDEWVTNWRVFDSAGYSDLTSQFGSTTYMQPDGTSPLDPGGFSFLGRQAYLWIRNGDDPTPGTEWLLVSTTSWIFPAAADDPCCPKGLPYEWFASDLTSSDTPLFGAHGDSRGDGTFTDGNPYTLQTHTFVPEPATAALLALTVIALLRRPRSHPHRALPR